MKRLFILLLLTSCATAPKPLPIDTLIHEEPFNRSFWSIHIEDDAGQVLYSLNADKLTIPASNRKLFASAAVVTCLGADAQLVTEIRRDGEDLVIVGDGDPSLGSWRYDRSDDFEHVARVLHERGITRVRDVVADVSSFDRVLIPGNWKHGNLGADYAAPVDAIAWGENEVWENRAVPDPGLHAATALRDALFARGIEITGTPRVNTEKRTWGERLIALPSPFVAHLLHAVLKNSHNLYAEMLLKRIGGGTYENAFAIERTFLTNEVRLDGHTFRFVDGSGLAPDDLVTPRATIAILRWMNHPSRRATWWPILAQPNNDGTLRRRLIPLEARFRGKTGTINGVNALSGIIEMPDGRYRYFCAVANHHIGASSDANRIIDSMVELVAGTFPRTSSTP